jgi:phenylpyruvate tautomerase PptA (4-oxalocrotonate tautomerase family)
MTNITLTAGQCNDLKQETARIMTEIAGKSEQWLMVIVEGDKNLYYQGNGIKPAAFISVEYVGDFSDVQKDGITTELCAAVHRKAGISSDRIYITFAGYSRSNWGWNGALLG